MKKITLLSVMALLCLNFNQSSLAQQIPIKPIRVGEKLPDWFWKQGHEVFRNNKTERETLEQYKDNLLILDFWATWCSSCIKKFPLADSLQKKYPNKLSFILINAKRSNDKLEHLAKVMGSYAKNLKTITGDTSLTALFPHTAIPHYIWIESGQLKSITGAELLTEASIKAFLNSSAHRDSTRKERLKRIGKL